MKRSLLLVLPFSVGVTTLGARYETHGRGSSRAIAAHEALSRSSGGAVVTDEEQADEGARAAVRRQLRRREAGTYISEILLERDSALARWPDRRGRPLKIWIQPQSDVPDWTSAYVGRARSAFAEWTALDLPIGFTFVEDSAEADVHVSWISRFSEPISGRTKWARDDAWWITDADIVLAVHHHGGEVLDEEAMQAMALHEIGHLLGLDHTEDPGSIMAPKVRVRDLSTADIATTRLLYTLPPGAVR